MDPLVVFILVIVALRLVALMLGAMASRRTEPAGVPRSHVDPCLGPVLAVRPSVRAVPVPRSHVDPCLGPVLAVPPSVRAVPAMPSEESLFRQLTSGAITRAQYRGAMAELAAREETQPQR